MKKKREGGRERRSGECSRNAVPGSDDDGLQVLVDVSNSRRLIAGIDKERQRPFAEGEKLQSKGRFLPKDRSAFLARWRKVKSEHLGNGSYSKQTVAREYQSASLLSQAGAWYARPEGL